MKKERLVVFCLCAVLLGTVYAQWIAWALHLLGPSAGWSEGPSRAEAPTQSVVEFISAGWSPLGFVYAEVLRLRGQSVAPNENMPNTAKRLSGRMIE